MLPGNEVALFDGALLAVAALALQKTASCPRAGRAGKPGRCIVPSSLSLPFYSGAVYGLAGLRPAYFSPFAHGRRESSSCDGYSGNPPRQALLKHQTLRFLGGRQPLCGIGVASLNGADFQAGGGQRTHGGFAARARAADAHFHAAQARFRWPCWPPSTLPAARRREFLCATRGSRANRRSTTDHVLPS